MAAPVELLFIRFSASAFRVLELSARVAPDHLDVLAV
jgi:hypothetical protein